MKKRSVERKKELPDYNPLVKHDFETILFGIMIVLLGVLGLTNGTFVSGLFNYAVTVFIGNYAFLGFLYVIFTGFYRIFTKKAFAYKWSILSVGIMILAVSSLGLATHITLNGTTGYEPLTLINFFPSFRDHLPLIKDIPTAYPSEVSGGLIGYLALGLANSIVGTTNGLVLIVISLVVGFLLALNVIWKQLYRLIKRRMAIVKHERQQFEAAKAVARPVPTAEEPKQNTAYVTPKQPMGNKTAGYTRSLNEIGPSATLQKVQYVPKGTKAATDGQRQSLPTPPTIPKEIEIAPHVIPAAPTSNYVPTLQDGLEQPALRPLAVPPSHDKPAQAVPEYVFPSIDLLEDIPEDADFEYNDEVSLRRMESINQIFNDFNVKAEAVSYQIGPSVTSFDIVLDRTTLVKSVTSIINDISIRIGGMACIFNEVVFGKTNPTLEVPNEKISIVSYKEILKALNVRGDLHGKIAIPFGKNIQGGIEVSTLREVVHMIVAGTTGSGKSVFMHTLITTILMRSTPDEIRLLIIDPKRVEMSRYAELQHLLAPIVTDYSEAKVALTRLTMEMKNRYELFKDAGVSNIESYNRFAKDNGDEVLPLIATVIDEYADLAEGITGITELVELLSAQARASGIHLIIATQRPVTKIISGNIKNNITTKVALQMSSQVDSVTVLGHAGAEKLLGNGDMIVSCPKLSRHGELRLQGAYVTEEDTIRIANDLRARHKPNYHHSFLHLVDETASGPLFEGGYELKPDERYDEIKQYAMTQEYLSANRLVRYFNFSFSRAANLISLLKKDGILAQAPDSPQSNKGLRVIVNDTSNDK